MTAFSLWNFAHNHLYCYRILLLQIGRLYVIRWPLADWQNLGTATRSTYSYLLKFSNNWIRSPFSLRFSSVMISILFSLSSFSRPLRFLFIHCRFVLNSFDCIDINLETISAQRIQLKDEQKWCKMFSTNYCPMFKAFS